MALDWVTRTNYDPPMIGACVNKNNASSSAILDTKEFSVNVTSVDMLEVTDYTGLVSGKRVDKSAPMIKKCPLNIECWLAEPVELPTNCFFIAEIINLYSSEKFLSDGKPDVQKSGILF